MARSPDKARAAIAVAALLSGFATAQASPSITVGVEGELLNVVVTEPQSLDDILKQLAKASGVTVKGGGAKTTGPISLYRVTFEDALRSLAPDHSFIIEREGATSKIRRILLIAPAAEGVAPTGDNIHAPVPQPTGEEDEYPDAAQAQAAAMQRLTMSPHDTARNNQAVALRNIVKLSYGKDKASADQLEQLARSGDDPTVRAAALSTLSKTSGLGAVPFLKSRLLGDPDPQMRLAAARALYHIDRKQAKTLIGQAIAMERDPALREQLQALTGN